MPAQSFRDIVIVLPGITGSVLQADGKDVWGTSLQAIVPAVTSLGASLERLVVHGEDPAADDLGDGVRATALVPRVVVPGLMKIDGYTQMLDLIANSFDVVRGDLDEVAPANFFAFPYDWRRDNRVTARKLKALVDSRLPLWRKYYPDAKVVLLAHSMGGLVSRYYLEVLEGWPTCKALVTFGTPFRGSLDALGYVANGYKQMFLDLTAMLRTCVSVYQLMPIYEAVKIDGTYRRAAESPEIPNLDRKMALDALAFHREIEAAVERHRQDAGYLQSYRTIPFVGTMQPTLQSAELAAGKLSVGRSLPDIVDSNLDLGDGTVPRVSAIPLELSDDYRETFYPERHSALPANAAMLNDLWHRLQQMQAKGTMSVRGPAKAESQDGQPALGIDLEDGYVVGEPVDIRALAHNTSGDVTLEAEVTRVDWTATPEKRSLPLRPDGAGLKASFEGLVPGQYRLSVRGIGASAALPAVHDIFEVVGASAVA